MADEEDPWAFDDTESNQKNTASTPDSVKPVEVSTTITSTMDDAGNNITEIAAVAEIAETELKAPPPIEDDGYRKPVQLYRHWVRPKFLQYKYMYNYRTNYYDDVIDYLDKKLVGVNREIPRPQTWAERVLRSNYSSGRDIDAYSACGKKDKHLIQTLAASIRTYNYHTKAYINQRYANVL